MLQDFHLIDTTTTRVPRAREVSREAAAIAETLLNANTLFKHGETHLALNMLRGLCSKDPKNEKLMTLLAEKLEAHGYHDEAVKVRKSLLSVHCTYINSVHYAHALYRLNRDQEALAGYYESLAMQVDEDMTAFEIYKNMGNIFLKGGDVESAEEFFNKAYVLFPESDVLLVNLGTLEIQKGDLTKALECFRRAVEINPENDKAWTGLAMLHGELGDHELAWGNLERALDHNSRNRTALILAANWSSRDRTPQHAIPYLENYLAHQDFDEELAVVLVNMYCLASRFQNAALECARILAWNPNHVEVRALAEKIEAGAL